MIDFIKIGEVGNIPALQFEVLKNQALFDEFTIRQEYRGTAHGDTKTIPLRLGKSITPETKAEDLTPHIMLDEMEFEDWGNFDKFPAVRATISEIMDAMNLVELGWATIVSLKPGGKIEPHKDEGEYCANFSRLHVCIYSEQDVSVIMVNREPYLVKVGDIITFDNKAEHSAGNRSKTHERIHLIFDAR